MYKITWCGWPRDISALEHRGAGEKGSVLTVRIWTCCSTHHVPGSHSFFLYQLPCFHNELGSPQLVHQCFFQVLFIFLPLFMQQYPFWRVIVLWVMGPLTHTGSCHWWVKGIIRMDLPSDSHHCPFTHMHCDPIPISWHVWLVEALPRLMVDVSLDVKKTVILFIHSFIFTIMYWKARERTAQILWFVPQMITTARAESGQPGDRFHPGIPHGWQGPDYQWFYHCLPEGTLAVSWNCSQVGTVIQIF